MADSLRKRLRRLPRWQRELVGEIGAANAAAEQVGLPAVARLESRLREAAQAHGLDVRDLAAALASALDPRFMQGG
jgi:hypothetical protein